LIQRIFLQAILLLLLVPGIVHAEEIKDLYQADIEVEDKGSKARNAALREGMAEILIRVTGRTDVMLHPAIQQAIQDPRKYAITYQYLFIRKNGSRQRTLVLRVSMSERNINELLRESRLPIWGKSRPGVLVWLVVDNGKQRQLQGATYDNWITEALKESAQQRGLPVQLPLLDAQDQSLVKMSDIWGGFTTPVMTASKRYQNPAVLMGRVYLDNSHTWHGRWTLVLHGTSVTWQVQGKRLASVIAQGMDEISERIAFEYAYMQSEHTHSVYLRIHNINSLEDMVRVQRYLQSQVGVTAAQPVEIKQGEVFFRLTLDGRWQTIAQSIALSSRLVAQQPPADNPQPDGNKPSTNPANIPEDLIYRYRYLP
jgi:hypothetical protein